MTTNDWHGDDDEAPSKLTHEERTEFIVLMNKSDWSEAERSRVAELKAKVLP